MSSPSRPSESEVVRGLPESPVRAPYKGADCGLVESGTSTSPNSGDATNYRRLPISEKRARDVARVREPSIRCPRCSCSVMPSELMPHMEMRCAGQLPAAHPRARWMLRRDAMAMAVMPATFDRWLQLGLVRVNADGRFNESDVVQCCAWSRALGVL